MQLTVTKMAHIILNGEKAFSKTETSSVLIFPENRRNTKIVSLSAHLLPRHISQCMINVLRTSPGTPQSKLIGRSREMHMTDAICCGFIIPWPFRHLEANFWTGTMGAGYGILHKETIFAVQFREYPKSCFCERRGGDANERSIRDRCGAPELWPNERAESERLRVFDVCEQDLSIYFRGRF